MTGEKCTYPATIDFPAVRTIASTGEQQRQSGSNGKTKKKSNHRMRRATTTPPRDIGGRSA